MNIVTYYLIAGLVYTSIMWAIKRNGIIAVMNKPEYRGLEKPIMAIAAIVIVCIWPGVLVTSVITHFKKKAR